MTGHAHAPAAGGAGATHAHTPAWQLVVAVTLGGAFAGALIAYVYQETLPAIERSADARIGGAVREVLAAPARLDTLYLIGDTLSRTPPVGVELRAATKAFVGYDAAGRRIGVAVEAGAPGFTDQVRLMVGFDPTTSTLTGYAMLSQIETPGLGDKIEKDSAFVAQFDGKVTPMTGTKSGTTDPHVVQTITGATISSRVVIRIINNAVAQWQPRLAAFDQRSPR